MPPRRHSARRLRFAPRATPATLRSGDSSRLPPRRRRRRDVRRSPTTPTLVLAAARTRCPTPALHAATRSTAARSSTPPLLLALISPSQQRLKTLRLRLAHLPSSCCPLVAVASCSDAARPLGVAPARPRFLARLRARSSLGRSAPPPASPRVPRGSRGAPPACWRPRTLASIEPPRVMPRAAPHGSAVAGRPCWPLCSLRSLAAAPLASLFARLGSCGYGPLAGYVPPARSGAAALGAAFAPSRRGSLAPAFALLRRVHVSRRSAAVAARSARRRRGGFAPGPPMPLASLAAAPPQVCRVEGAAAAPSLAQSILVAPRPIRW